MSSDRAHGTGHLLRLPDLRAAGRRGLGELATASAIAHGFDRGADVAALQASPMGEALYRRMGFVELYRYEEYLVFPT